jgi:hypothetical protein
MTSECESCRTPAAEDLLEIIMRRYERFSTLLTPNRPVEDRGRRLGDVAAVSAMLDRLLHHGHVLKCGPRSWRTKTRRDVTNDLLSDCRVVDGVTPKLWARVYHRGFGLSSTRPNSGGPACVNFPSCHRYLVLTNPVEQQSASLFSGSNKSRMNSPFVTMTR